MEQQEELQVATVESNHDGFVGGGREESRNSEVGQSETVTFDIEDREDSRTSNNEVFIDQDIPIQFEKKSIPKPRTQSVQSVLSSVSLRSLVHQSLQNKKAFVPPPQQHSQPQFIHANTHIQAPAIAASSKRRASFEIGQRLPFIKDDNINEDNEVIEDSIENEVDNELTQDDQKKLTDDALKKLSSFSKFIPAEVDLKMKHTNNSNSVDSNENKIDSIISNNSPELSRINMRNPSFINPSTSIPSSLARKPLSNQSLASKQRDEKPNLLSNTTSSQNLLTTFKQPMIRSQSMTSNANNNNNNIKEDLSRSTSPKKQFDQESLQTINDPKRPMYMPAVLRQSNTNLKPEDLKHINEQNSKRSKSLITDAATSLRSQTSHWKLAFNSNSKNSPTKAHWRRDLSRNTCAYCDKQFTFFERRHHCRHCGDIFCAEHTSNFLKLGIDAQFTVAGSGVLCKVCDNCYDDYKNFLKNKFGNDINVNGSLKRDVPMNNERKKSVVENNLSGSVPADWSWSSF